MNLDTNINTNPLLESVPYFVKNNLGIIHSIKISKYQISRQEISITTQQLSPVPFYFPLSSNYYVTYGIEEDPITYPLITVPIITPPSWRNNNIKNGKVYIKSDVLGSLYLPNGNPLEIVKNYFTIPYHDLSNGFSFRYKPLNKYSLLDKITYFVSNDCYSLDSVGKNCFPLLYNSSSSESNDFSNINYSDFFNPTSISSKNSTSSEIQIYISHSTILTSTNISLNAYYSASTPFSLNYTINTLNQKAKSVVFSQCSPVISIAYVDSSSNQVIIDCSVASVEVLVSDSYIYQLSSLKYSIKNYFSIVVSDTDSISASFNYQIKNTLDIISYNYTASISLGYNIDESSSIMNENSNNLISFKSYESSNIEYVLGASNFPSVGVFKVEDVVLPSLSSDVNIIGEFNEETSKYGLNITYIPPENFFTIPKLSWNNKIVGNDSLSFQYYLTKKDPSGTNNFINGKTKNFDVININNPTKLSYLKPNQKLSVKTVDSSIEAMPSDRILLIDSFLLIDPDYGIDPIKVKITTSGDSYFRLNSTGFESDIITGYSTDYTSLQYCFNTQEICINKLDKFNNNLVFVGASSAVNSILNTMEFISISSKNSDHINITIFDGQGPLCFFHNTETIYNNNCYVESLSIEVQLISSNNNFESNYSSLGLIYIIIIVACCAGILICCFKYLCFSKKKNGKKEEKSEKNKSNDKEKNNDEEMNNNQQIIIVNSEQFTTPPHSPYRYNNLPTYSPSPLSTPSRPLLTNLTPIYQSPVNSQVNAAFLDNQMMITYEDLNNAIANNNLKGSKKETSKKSKSVSNAAVISFPEIKQPKSSKKSITTASAAMFNDIELAELNNQFEVEAFNKHLRNNSVIIQEVPIERKKKVKKSKTSENAAEMTMEVKPKKKSATSVNATIISPPRTPEIPKKSRTSSNAGVISSPEITSRKIIEKLDNFYNSPNNLSQSGYILPSQQQRYTLSSPNAATVGISQSRAVAYYPNEIELGNFEMYNQSNYFIPPPPPELMHQKSKEKTKKKSTTTPTAASIEFYDPRKVSSTTSPKAATDVKKKTLKSSTTASAGSLPKKKKIKQSKQEDIDDNEYIRAIVDSNGELRYIDLRTNSFLD